MTVELMPHLEIGPADATHAVLWLHGLGDSGHGHEDVVRMLELPATARVRFILPHAPQIPVTLNGGMVMPAWYDVLALGGASRHDLEGLARSSDGLRAFMARERERGVPSERTFLAGFSQGGVVALWTALRHPEALAGVIGLSTYLIEGDRFEEEIQEANARLPVFIGHGTYDPMVPVEAGMKSKERLESLGHPVEHHTYPMEHSLCAEEVNDVSAWMSRLL